jgi:hypothetical protein
MKDKKLIYYICGVTVLLLIVAILIILFSKANSNDVDNTNRDNDIKNSGLVKEVLKNKNKDKNDYKKFIGGEVLSDSTNFIEYAFISNNRAYIYNPEKLKNEELSYKFVYEIPSNIVVTNIGIPHGADIYFYDSTGREYTIYDDNVDNNIEDSFDMFERATYKFKEVDNALYSVAHNLTRDYDLRCNQFYVKDNILYEIQEEYYHFTEKRTVHATTYKVNGNYEGEKILRIYNDRILKTDKGFYEIARYSGDDGPITTTFKIDLLSKYYDEVLTFTYEYVVLKDYTLIPIDDVMINRNKKYQTSFYVDRFEEKKNVFVE